MQVSGWLLTFILRMFYTDYIHFVLTLRLMFLFPHFYKQNTSATKMFLLFESGEEQ